MAVVDIWAQRVLREWIDNKWGGVPAALWDLTTIVSIGIAGALLGLLWTIRTDAEGLSDVFVILLWTGAGLAGGWVYVVLRRPS